VVTEALSWHWVFLGLVLAVGVVVLAVGLVVPAVRRLDPPQHDSDSASPPPGLVTAALAAAAAVSALSWASQRVSMLTAAVGGIAVLLLVPALRGCFRVGSSARGPAFPLSWPAAVCWLGCSSPSTPTFHCR
jgi:hypothetical protein